MGRFSADLVELTPGARLGPCEIIAPVRLTEISVERGKPQPLFDVHDTDTRFRVSRDGKRFLIALPLPQAATSSPLTVYADWQAEAPK